MTNGLKILVFSIFGTNTRGNLISKLKPLNGPSCTIYMQPFTRMSAWGLQSAQFNTVVQQHKASGES